MRDQELVNALRCVSTAGGPIGDCKKCPFCKTEPVPKNLAETVSLTEWSSCDVDAVGLAAADRIANQSTHIAALQQEIEKLRGQNEQLREAAALVTKESAELLERRWIPVEERLPENFQKVLCWGEYFRYGDFNAMFADYALGYQINGSWGGAVAIGTKARALAWMPLPEPPEVENA